MREGRLLLEGEQSPWSAGKTNRTALNDLRNQHNKPSIVYPARMNTGEASKFATSFIDQIIHVMIDRNALRHILDRDSRVRSIQGVSMEENELK
jgi:hypothetical protein